MPRKHRVTCLSALAGTALVLLFVWAVCAPGAAQAQTKFSISKCPDGPLPLPITIDCSHTKDPAAQAACRPFLETTACKVFPAYRQITGIKMEDFCKTFQYVIYDQDNWPYTSAGAGGMTIGCNVSYQARYSVLSSFAMGPYDVHEILHGYHHGIGRVPDQHVLFSSSMAEAIRVIGDDATYRKRLQSISDETKNLEKEFQEDKIKPQDRCKVANTLFDELLYLKNTNIVSEYYAWLLQHPEKGKENPQVRFNRMFNAVSKGEARRFMAQHGCDVF